MPQRLTQAFQRVFNGLDGLNRVYLHDFQAIEIAKILAIIFIGL
ncbi:hypothetical protein [Variibacter gotjawalensis]|nr:hypothetical protein [Variibacter gotjawalensis]NIK48053.1 hypothetical protein [Variibacter gotjawalensis]